MEQPLTSWIGWLHFLGALAALAIGLIVIFNRKGTARHRLLGSVYVILLVTLNVSALSLHREDAFGPFHILAVLSLITIAVGVGLLVLTSGPEHLVAAHAYMMSWSYVGLVAAGTGQLTVTLKLNIGSATWVVILLTLFVGGIVIHLRIPRTLRALFRQEPGGINIPNIQSHE